MHTLFVIAAGVITTPPSNASVNPSNLSGIVPVPSGASGYAPYAPQTINGAAILLIALAIILAIGLFVYWRRLKGKR